MKKNSDRIISRDSLDRICSALALKDAEFGGSDDAGSQVVEEVDSSFQPIAEPILEKILGRELPGEVESLLFCVQASIGVGILAFFMGRFVERKKLGKGE